MLDTREYEEFEVSHLRGAIWAGFDSFDLARLTSKLPDKDRAIVVYCSVGIRSEDIGAKLIEAGYTNVKNLYGGIFMWANEGFPVIDPQGKATNKVHAFSKEWGHLLTKGEKVY